MRAPLFDNKYMMLHNALPSVTLGKLHEKAGVRLRNKRAENREVFVLDVHWGGGEEHNSHSLMPGKAMRLAERDAREIIQDYKPSAGLCATAPGLAMFRDDADRQSAILEALMIAEEHYHICGAQQLDAVRNLRGHKDDEVERYRSSTYATYFLAMAKEDLIREHRLTLEGKQKKAS